MKKKDVKTNLMDHSGAKVRLLKEYLKRYLNIICNDGYTTKIHVYDLFCSQGLYDDGGEGSPLIALREIKNVHYVNVSRAKNVPEMDCHFNDIESDKINILKEAIKSKSLHYPNFGKLECTSEDYQNQIQLLYSELPRMKRRNEKAFIFIDPYEYKHIRADQIKKLLANKNAEILLWLPTQFMYRFEKNGTPEALKDFIHELVPFDEWRKSQNARSFVMQLRDEFSKYLGEGYFVDTFTIKKDPSTLFCLFFFSSHIRGFEKMLESKWAIDEEEGEGWTYSSQAGLFGSLKLNALEEKLMDFLSKERTNNDLYYFILKNGYLPKHAVEIFRDWQDSNKMEVLNMDGTKARKHSFYITYKNYRDGLLKSKINLL